jgi:SAM-dependent methyltransferase
MGMDGASERHLSTLQDAPAAPPFGRNKAAMTKLVEQLFGGREREVEVLEVGGGAVSRLRLQNARDTVLEIDERSLQGSTYADEIIIGSIETIDLPDRDFDVAAFFFVLEHVSSPRIALTRAIDLLRPGGLLVIAGPNPRSLQGLVTRYTPHWAHVAFYRLIKRDPMAGRPGYAPFPTHLSEDATFEQIIQIAGQRRCKLIYEEHYVGPNVEQLRERSRILHGVYQAASLALKLGTRSRLGAPTSDFALVFQKD